MIYLLVLILIIIQLPSTQSIELIEEESYDADISDGSPLSFTFFPVTGHNTELEFENLPDDLCSLTVDCVDIGGETHSESDTSLCEECSETSYFISLEFLFEEIPALEEPVNIELTCENTYAETITVLARSVERSHTFFSAMNILGFVFCLLCFVGYMVCICIVCGLVGFFVVKQLLKKRDEKYQLMDSN